MQTPPRVRTRRTCWAVPGTKDETVTKKRRQGSLSHSEVRGGSFSWIVFPFYTKRGKHCFRAKNPVPPSRSWKSSRTQGRAPLTLQPDSSSERPQEPWRPGPRHKACSLGTRGQGSALRGCGGLGGSRLLLRRSGLPVAVGLQRSAWAPGGWQAAHIHRTQFPSPLLRGWQKKLLHQWLGHVGGVGRGAHARATRPP